MFPQFLAKKRTSESVQDVEELTLVELLEADNDQHTRQGVNQPSASNPSVPGAQAYVNRLLVRIQDIAKLQSVKLTAGLTSHSFRRGGAMHANDGSVAENWIIERGGWQLDRVNKAFGYMLGSTQADQQVSRVLSGWKPKDGARLPSLAALEQPILGRAQKLQSLLFSNTLGFDDDPLNIDEDVADVLAATFLMHYPDMLRLCEAAPLVLKMREAMAARTIGEAEVLAWSSSIRRVFMPPTELKPSPSDTDQISTLLQHVQHQTEKIEVLILQNKRLEERLLAVENHMQVPVSTSSQDPPSVRASSSAAEGQSTTKVARAKKKGSQSLAAIWFEWFTAEPRVYASPVVKKTTLYEFRHITGYMMLFLPTGFALDVASQLTKTKYWPLAIKHAKVRSSS
ncbi:hypothetical protein AM587_10000499 [Phytophthora nicotianae]|uniref:Uncharacterized protein n=1 Tax=Phytophthora nicotianae TaxID=4792 RepID=A0A0W8E010_PHYNI|nr:hypothetical protein AM587_10000499 [Phytophthora nicotianae]